MVRNKCDHIRTIRAFSELTVGTVAKYGRVTFVKLSEGQPDAPSPMQHPNAISLDTNHYMVIRPQTSCEVIKTIYDSEFCQFK